MDNYQDWTTYDNRQGFQRVDESTVEKIIRKDQSVPYSESLASRTRHILGGQRGITEKKMFGGLVFLLHGNICVGVWKYSLIVRLGPDQAERALQEPNVGEFDVTGKPMKGWVLVDAEGLESDGQLLDWVTRAQEFVRTLPPK